MMVQGMRALIVTHSAVFGQRQTSVRKWSIGKSEPCGQHPVSVSILFYEPKKRRPALFRIVPDNLKYLTVEQDGAVIYDSRSDVPCDMGKWRAMAERWRHVPIS
jgi:hypothetical protein